MVGWHDPISAFASTITNAIEEAVPLGRMRFIAESSLSLLSEPHLQRLRRNGFCQPAAGDRSWYTLGNKSRTGRRRPEKVQQVADHVNMVLRYVPYVQTNPCWTGQ